MLVKQDRTSLVAQMVKCLPAMRETWVRSLGQDDPWRRKWQPTPVLLPGKSHEQRSLVGYSPWGHKESDTLLSDFTFTFKCEAKSSVDTETLRSTYCPALSL